MSNNAHGRISSLKIGRFVIIALVVGAFALVVTGAVSLRSEAKKSAPQADTRAQNTPANVRFQASAQVPLDPQTGQVRPLTQAEARQLAAGIRQLVNKSTEGLESVKHADGSVSMDLQGRFQNVAVAKLDEDGRLTQSCVDNPESAAAFFGIDPELVGGKRVAGAPSTNNAERKGRDQ